MIQTIKKQLKYKFQIKYPDIFVLTDKTQNVFGSISISINIGLFHTLISTLHKPVKVLGSTSSKKLEFKSN